MISDSDHDVLLAAIRSQPATTSALAALINAPADAVHNHLMRHGRSCRVRLRPGTAGEPTWSVRPADEDPERTLPPDL